MYRSVSPIAYEVVYSAEITVTGSTVQKHNIFLPVIPETDSQTNLQEVQVTVNGQEIGKELLDDGENRSWKIVITDTQNVNLEAKYLIGRYKWLKLPYPPKDIPALSDQDRERYTREVLPYLNFRSRAFQEWLNQKNLRWNPSVETLDSFVVRALGEASGVKYESNTKATSALESTTAISRDCSDASILLVSILRSNLIPSRYKGGLSLSVGYKATERNHAISEVWMPMHGGWVPIDPTPTIGIHKKGERHLGHEYGDFITLGLDTRNLVQFDGCDPEYKPVAILNLRYWSDRKGSKCEVKTSVKTSILDANPSPSDDPVEESVPSPEPEPTEPAE
jgi:hypothetical protein